MDELIIRKAFLKDIPGVMNVNRLCMRSGSRNGLIQLRLREEFEKLLGICKWFIVAEMQGKLIGYLTVLDESAQAEYPENEIFSFYKKYSNFVFVDQVATLPEHRKKGVASAMYRYFLDKEKKRVLVDFLIKPRNSDSISFHEALGFSPIGDIIRLKNGMEAEVYEYRPLYRNS